MGCKNATAIEYLSASRCVTVNVKSLDDSSLQWEKEQFIEKCIPKTVLKLLFLADILKPEDV